MSTRFARPEWAVEIERLREKLYLSQAALAKVLNVSAMAPSRWERGINEPPGEIYIQLGKLAGSPLCWDFWKRAGLERRDVEKVLAPEALQGRGDASEALLPVMSAGWTGLLPGRRIPAAEVQDHIAVPRAWCPHPAKMVCFVLADDSMSPELRRGFLVAVDLTFHKPADLLEQVVAVESQGRVLLRTLHGRSTSVVLLANDRSMPEIPLTGATALVGKPMWWLGRPTVPEKRKRTTAALRS